MWENTPFLWIEVFSVFFPPTNLAVSPLVGASLASERGVESVSQKLWPKCFRVSCASPRVVGPQNPKQTTGSLFSVVLCPLRSAPLFCPLFICRGMRRLAAFDSCSSAGYLRLKPSEGCFSTGINERGFSLAPPSPTSRPTIRAVVQKTATLGVGLTRKEKGTPSLFIRE